MNEAAIAEAITEAARRGGAVVVPAVTELYCRHPEDHDLDMAALMDEKRCPRDRTDSGSRVYAGHYDVDGSRWTRLLRACGPRRKGEAAGRDRAAGGGAPG